MQTLLFSSLLAQFPPLEFLPLLAPAHTMNCTLNTVSFFWFSFFFPFPFYNVLCFFFWFVFLILFCFSLFQQTRTLRPVAGFINFDPAAIENSASRSDIGIAMHEMTHALGFSMGRFDTFFDEETNLTVPVEEVLSTVNNISKIITPTVLEKAREHFDCETLDGAELENQGSSGTAGSHWEKRIFNSEYMIGQQTEYPVLSAITLALMQDTGWYKADFSFAESLPWGYRRGCDFVEETCEEGWPKNEGYFCSDPSFASCNFNRRGRGYCQLAEYSTDLPEEYQYFSDPRVGGTDSYADYCPYVGAIEWCSDSDDQDDDDIVDRGESYCETCRCFESTLAKGSSSAADPIFGCYNITCTAPNRLKIQVDEYWYTCPFGGSTKIIDYGGEIECPDDEAICAGATYDTEWPEFASIEPTSGHPGTEITIIGKLHKKKEERKAKKKMKMISF
jgi:leishmanolysin